MLNSRCCFAEEGTDLFKIACRTRSTLIFSHSTYQILSLCRCRSCCRLQRSSSLSSYHWPSSRVPQLHSKAAGIVLCIVALLQYLQPHICQSPEKHRARKVKSFQPSNFQRVPESHGRRLMTQSSHWNACKLSMGVETLKNDQIRIRQFHVCPPPPSGKPRAFEIQTCPHSQEFEKLAMSCNWRPIDFWSAVNNKNKTPLHLFLLSVHRK